MTESIALGISALVVGLLDGLIGAVLLAWYISLSIPIQVAFPVENIALWLVISFIITLASTLLPSYRSSRKNIVATISGRPMTSSFIERPQPTFFQTTQTAVTSEISTVSNPSISPLREVRIFIKQHTLKMQTVLLLLLAIFTINYILDDTLIIRGLILPYILIEGIGLSPYIFIDEGFIPPFVAINPILFFGGLTAVIPICGYFAGHINARSLLRSAGGSLLWGIFSFILLMISLSVCLIGLGLLFIPINEAITSRGFLIWEFSYLFTTFFLVIYLTLGILIILLFQRMWVFLIIRGTNPQLKLSEQMGITRKNGGKGFGGFLFIVLLYLLLQYPLTFIVGPIPIPEFTGLPMVYPEGLGFVMNPWQFLIHSLYEIGFYLLIIVYQIVQLQKIKLPNTIEASR
jgi:hypothetical protein